MLKIKTTPNLYGVTVMGDFDDLHELYDSLGRYLQFYIDNNKDFPDSEYEYTLALNYDIRHAFMGSRGYELIDSNFSGRGHKQNVYYTVEILYPLVFHYLCILDLILKDAPRDDWFYTACEYGGKWNERYSMIQAMRDRAVISGFIALLWSNIEELFGEDRAKCMYDLYNELICPVPMSLYCDALIHCQLVYFPELNRKEKLQFLTAAFYEIIEIGSIRRRLRIIEVNKRYYRDAVAQLNSKACKPFPVRREFFIKLDKAYNAVETFYREDFDRFLDETYGPDPDPYETKAFEW